MIIDVAFPSDPAAFSPEDFVCAYVNSSGYWETIVPEITVEVVTNLEEEEGQGEPADGVYDCHRVRLTFNTGIYTWLEVTMYDSDLGVSSDTFYFAHYLAGRRQRRRITWGDADLDVKVRAILADNLPRSTTVPVAGDINSATDYVTAPPT